MKQYTHWELEELWKAMDDNGNGLVSLAEIDRYVTKNFPEYNSAHYKPALVRAYKLADADGSGLISRDEFGTLIRGLAYFNDLWKRFEAVDTDGDRSVTLAEFVEGRAALGLGRLSAAGAEALFVQVDVDGSGRLRFYELATFCASHLAADDATGGVAEQAVGADGTLLAPRSGGGGGGTTLAEAATMRATRARKQAAQAQAAKEARPARKNHMSYDGLLVTAPKGTKFENEWCVHCWFFFFFFFFFF